MDRAAQACWPGGAYPHCLWGPVRAVSVTSPTPCSCPALATLAAGATLTAHCWCWTSTSQLLPCCHSRLVSLTCILCFYGMPVTVTSMAADDSGLLMLYMIQLAPAKSRSSSMTGGSLGRLQPLWSPEQSLVQACNASFKLLQSHQLLS